MHWSALLSLACVAQARNPGVAPRAHWVDPALDCGLRLLAYNYSTQLFEDGDAHSLVFDALRLGSDCGQPPPLPRARTPAAAAQQPSVPTFFISPQGSDAADGSLAAPFASLARGLEASRAGAAPALLYLRAGTYFQPSPLLLTAEDSGLTISSYPGDASPVISGGQLLPALSWSVYQALPSGSTTGPFPGISVVSDTPGLLPGGNASGIVYAGSLPSASACRDACAASAICTSYTWHDATVTGDYALQCFFRTDGVYAPTSPWPGHFAGQRTPGQNATIWRAPLPPSVAPDFLNLYDGARGRRVTRARTPNGNPEETIAGFASGATAWLPPHAYPPPQEVHIADPSRADDPFFPTYQLGLGGTCAIFSPASGFWCTRSPPAGSQFNVPSGVQLPAGLLGDFGDAAGAVFHAFHGERWGDWKFAVEAGNATAGLLTWNYGGFQECRGAASGSTFMLENLLALLDEHDEWYVDAATATLYLAVNNSQPLPSALIATRLDSVLRLEGTPDAPVRSVSLVGLTFSHTAPTFMKPFMSASGGDWSTRVDGTLWLEGTEGAVVEGCNFEGVGGNAVFLYGYNRGALISRTRFRHVGDSAIVSLGKVQGMDGSAQEAPFGTRVQGCLASEFGLYTKQSGFYYNGQSGNSSIVQNVFFNMPRAGININDGYAGGHYIAQNLAFNCVRETSDHGCFNSWDRQPYIWNPLDLTNLYPAPSTITRNLFYNNFHSTWPIDHDDGSNAYLDTYNLLIWGGGKNYLGLNKTQFGNFYLFPEANEPTVAGAVGAGTGFSPYCYGSQGSSALPPALRDVWVGETCITGSGPATLYSLGGCNPSAPQDGHVPVLANNTLYTPDASYQLDCGGQVWDLPTAQAHGLDLGTTLLKTPDTPTILALVQAFIANTIEG